MKLNRADRRRAKRLGYKTCPICGQYMIDGVDQFMHPETNVRICKECGVESFSSEIRNNDSKIAIMVTLDGNARLVTCNDAFEAIAGAKIPDLSEPKPSVRFCAGGYDLWCEAGEPGTDAYRVYRIGTILKGLDELRDFIVPIKLEDLVTIPEARRESENFLVEPLYTKDGSFVTNRVTAKESGKTYYMNTSELLKGAFNEGQEAE